MIYLKQVCNLWVTVVDHGIMDTTLFLQMYLQDASSVA